MIVDESMNVDVSHHASSFIQTFRGRWRLSAGTWAVINVGGILHCHRAGHV